MLLGLGTLMSLGFSLGVCAGLEAFENLMWLWLLPASFIGFFAVMALLAFLFLRLACACVDMHVMPEKDSSFFRNMIYLLMEAALPFMGIRLHTTGMEKMPKGRFLLVCNHISDMDPVMLLWMFRKYQLAFISKRENDERPIVGPVMRKLMCQPINRENDREALKTILRCIQLLKEDKVSVAVFPEGYTSLDGLLRPFRSGVFKIAQKAEVPIVVCTAKNTRYIFGNAKKLKPTEVYIDVVDVLYPDSFHGQTTVELGRRIYEMMAEHMGPEYVYHALDSEE